MATGINADKISSLKIYLLDYNESINSFITRLYDCRNKVSSNIDGVSKNEILSKLDLVISQVTNSLRISNSYISILNGLVDSYVDQDNLLSSKLNNDINKIY